MHDIFLCLRKMSPFLYFVIALSDVIQFCQFLVETYPREFETNTFAQPTTPRLYCTL